MLTPREKEIVLLVWEDLSNKQIATKLSISESTVENHLHNIFSKLDIVSRIGLVKKAIKMGILTICDEQ